MKHLLWLVMLAGGLPPLVPTLEAQGVGTVRAAGVPPCRVSRPCSTWRISDLRGTYAFTASAWQDLSEINPALPAGYAPVTRADCSFALSLSMKIDDFGGLISGPYSYVGVIAGDASALELDFMMLGVGPGSHVELDHAKRISMSVR